MKKHLLACASLLLIISTSCSALKTESAMPEQAPPAGSATLSMAVLPETTSELVKAMLQADWLLRFGSQNTLLPLILLGSLEGNTVSVQLADAYMQQLVADILHTTKIHLVIPKDGASPIVSPLDKSEAQLLRAQSQADFFLQSSIVQEGGYQWLELNLLQLDTFEIVWSETRNLDRMKI